VLETLPARQQGGERSDADGGGQRPLRARTAEHDAELTDDTLAGHHPQALRRRGKLSLAFGREPQLGVSRQKAGTAQNTQRVGDEVLLPHDTHPAGCEVVEPSDEVDQRAPRQPPEKRVDGEIPAEDVLLEVAGNGPQVDGVTTAGDAPGEEGGTPEGKAPATHGASQALPGIPRIAEHREIEVAGGDAQETIAQRPAGEKDLTRRPRRGETPQQGGGE
jgi:hypothetical protein